MSAPRYMEVSPLTPLLIDAQLPGLARLLASPLIQSANLENAWLAVAAGLYLQASLEYARLANRDPKLADDFERVLAEYVGNAAASKALGGKFLSAVLTGLAPRREEKGE